MRILIINQPYWPDVVATAQHLVDWTESLTARGHEVTVIASRSVYGKQGAVLEKQETHNGVAIYRVGTNLFGKGRILTRLIDFGLFHILALYRALRLPRQDVVVCLTTPPFVGTIGMLVKNLRGSRYVQYEMDLYPDVPVALGVLKPHSLITRFFEAFHRKLLRSADRVIVLGRCMQRVIESKGIPSRKLVLITPWADPVELSPTRSEHNAFRAKHGLRDNFVVMYSGNLGLGHDITTLIAAMEGLHASPDPADQAVRFVFIGGGRRMQEVRRAVSEKQLANVLLLDYQPREELADTLSAADIHVITQAPGTSGLIVPSKFYGILAVGRPSLYVGPPDTEVAMTLTENGLGSVLAIGDPAAFLTALRALRAHPPADLESKARAFLTACHSRQTCTDKLTATIESLAT
jgi:hypothetical protein